MPQNIKKLNKEEIEFIKNNYKTMTVKEMAKKFNISNKCMRGKLERINIKLSPLNRTKKVVWTKENIEFLKNNYIYKEYQEIAKQLGENFTKAIVYNKIRQLNLPRKNYIMSHKIKIDEYGYKYYNDGNKRIFTHREKIEKSIGRKLMSSETIHHIDCNKNNDDLENLFLCSSSKHKRLHYQLENISRELIKMGYIKFDKKKEEYCLTMPTRTEGYTKYSQGQRIESEKI